jgi:hypothetical protein
VSSMASEAKSEVLKCSLLICLQENCDCFLENDTKNMERVCALLSKMLEAGEPILIFQRKILIFSFNFLRFFRPHSAVSDSLYHHLSAE